MKVFTIIKENSERISAKNFRDLAGKPVWKWLIDELKDFDVYVNTDSEKLLDELQRYPNVTTIKRSKAHIDWELNAEIMGSPVMDMVRDFTEQYVAINEDFALVHVTSPFLKAETLKKAFSLYKQSNAYSLHSVRRIQDALMRYHEDKLIPENFCFDRVSRTQDLDPVYQSLGAFFIMNRALLIKNQFKRLMKNSLTYPLANYESIEIDHEVDLELANLVAIGLQTS